MFIRFYVIIFFLSLKQIGLYAQLNLDSGLYAHYPFDGNTINIQGNGFNGQLNGGPTLTSGKDQSANTAYQLDGINDYIQFPTDFDFPEKTLVLWVYILNLNNSISIIYTIDHPSLIHGKVSIAGINTNGEDFIRFTRGIGNTISNIRVNSNEWTMLAIAHDSMNNWYYVNDSLTGFTQGFSKSSSATLSTNNLGTSRFRDRFFEGKLDDYRVYDRVLSHCEIKYLYRGLEPPVFPDQVINACDSDFVFLKAPTGYSNYQWVLDTGVVFQKDLLFGPIINSGSFPSVVFEDTLGCQHNQNFRIENVGKFLPSLVDTSVCSGKTLSLINRIPQGYKIEFQNTQNLTFLPGNQILFQAENPSSDNSFDLIYPYSTQYDSFCLHQDTFTINIKPSIKNPVASKDTFCQEEKVIVTLNPYFIDHFYSWSEPQSWTSLGNGEFSYKMEIYNSRDGFLLVTDEENCNKEFSYEPKQELPIKLKIEGDSIFCPQFIESNYVIEASGINGDVELDSIWVVDGSIIKEDENQYHVLRPYPRSNPEIGAIVYSEFGCPDTKTSLTIFDDNDENCPEYAEVLFIPNTITPNGDGKNDYLKILIPRTVLKIEIKIFDRWGNTIFESKDYQNDWGGESQLPAGTYYYSAQTYGLEEKSYRGYIKLIK